MSNTIGKITGTRVADLMLPDKVYKQQASPCVAPELIVGLELEIEGWTGRGRDFFGMDYHEDGSLRNNGVEFVTKPTKMKFVRGLLEDFYKSFRVTPANYSERCSTHVHVNVQDFTLEQLATLAMLYQVFERPLFSYAEQERMNNIFCVPWCQTNITTNIVETITKGNWRGLRTWQKYTAMNLLPVQNRGTVEYRHLEGTCDVNKIMGWVSLLACMHEYARNKPLEEVKATILELNTSSAYEMFLQNVFGERLELFKSETLRLDMEQGVIDAKLLLTKDAGLLHVGEQVQMREWNGIIANNEEVVMANNATHWAQPFMRFTTADEVVPPTEAPVNPPAANANPVPRPARRNNIDARISLDEAIRRENQRIADRQRRDAQLPRGVINTRNP